jgi:hypothetical protein
VYLPVFDQRVAEKRASAAPHGAFDVSDDVQVEYARYRRSAEQYLTDGTAARWAYGHPGVLVGMYGHDIPLLLKLAQLDEPKVVFGKIVRGAYL